MWAGNVIYIRADPFREYEPIRKIRLFVRKTMLAEYEALYAAAAQKLAKLREASRQKHEAKKARRINSDHTPVG